MKVVNVGQLEVNMCVEELELLVELWHIAIDARIQQRRSPTGAGGNSCKI